MPTRPPLTRNSGTLSSIADRFFSLSGRRLIVSAAVVHVLLALGLFTAGRTQLISRLIDRDGIMPFAFDSYQYQSVAIELAELLRHGNFLSWAIAAQPMHAKIIAIPFALLGPVFGYGTLSAEPYNLVCYLAVLALVFALGREVGGRSVGLISGAIVAFWPTFLLHTLQLLKEPLFVVVLLAFTFCVVTWLSRTHTPGVAVGLSVLTAVLTLSVCLVRISFMVVIIAVAILGLVLIITRQLLERRLLIWNTALPIVVLLSALPLIPLYSSHTLQKTKQYPSDQSGQPKIVYSSELRVQTQVTRFTKSGDSSNATIDRLARQISSRRSSFAAAYPEAGSAIDANTEFRSMNDLLGYLPRAAAVGLWAPFPSAWILAGRRVGGAGRLVSGVETLLIYVFQVLAVIGILQQPRRLVLWFLLSVCFLAVTALALIVPNAGALYRFRYAFWMMLVIVAATGVKSFVTSRLGTHQREDQNAENLAISYQPNKVK